VKGGYLLDTNVLSELMKARPSPRVTAFFDTKPTEAFFLSDVVLGEIAFGIEITRDISTQQRLQRGLDQFVRPTFAGRVLGTTEATWITWKRIERDGRKRGYTFPQPDLVIASLALQHGLTIVTRDGEPFREAGVSVLDPWLA